MESEVTQALYQRIVGTNPSFFKGKTLPVERVSWDDATQFCAELTKKLPKGMEATLPTEAQWEYSCRAGMKTAYWFGDSFDSDKMNCDQLILSGVTKPVKSYAANPWGLNDMHGNVWEWCLDYYNEDYPSETETVVDPKDTNSSNYHVVRGGCWNLFPRHCSSATREGGSVGFRDNALGFRFLWICD